MNSSLVEKFLTVALYLQVCLSTPSVCPLHRSLTHRLVPLLPVHLRHHLPQHPPIICLSLCLLAPLHHLLPHPPHHSSPLYHPPYHHSLYLHLSTMLLLLPHLSTMLLLLALVLLIIIHLIRNIIHHYPQFHLQSCFQFFVKAAQK